ncbi:MAG: tetratricopeptide repeat protein [bacterium]|nr:tetratricopeptide repeat protein [bacterium]
MRFGWHITAALAAGLVAGCGLAPAPPLRYADAWRCEAPADSLGFDNVRALSPAARERRRAQALPWRQLAATTRDDAERLRALVTAFALAPDVPDHGFALAEAAGRVGDTQRALAALDAVEASLGELPAAERRAARLRLALARGWLHRDRGRWTLAHAWADSAARISPAEREVRMLQGLCRAAHGDLRGAYNISRDIETKEYFRFEWRWIRGVAELARGDVANAYYWLRDTRPEGPWSARFHRDLAMVCARVGDPVEARRFYNYSYDALGLGPGTCPGPADVPADEGDAKPARLPVWIAFGRLLAAGSPYGWALAATDSFTAAISPADRIAWADRAVDALGVCIRLDDHQEQCRAQRGLLYAEIGATNSPWRTSTASWPRGGSGGRRGAELAAPYGRLLNRAGRVEAAEEWLREALSAAPERAEIWSDLGYTLMMTGRAAQGEEALDRALALDPGLAAAWYNRGLHRYQARRWSEAADDFARALELAPDNPDIPPLLQQARARARR